MVWRLGALAVLAENPGLIPSIHMVAHIRTCKQNTQTPKINKLEKKKESKRHLEKAREEIQRFSGMRIHDSRFPPLILIIEYSLHMMIRGRMPGYPSSGRMLINGSVPSCPSPMLA